MRRTSSIDIITRILVTLTLAKDLRHFEMEELEDVDAVVQMAELSNYPAGRLAPTVKSVFALAHKDECYTLLK